VTSPAAFATTLNNAIASVLGAAGEAPRAAVAAYRELALLSSPEVPGGPGVAAAAAAANAELTMGLVHGSAIAGMVQAAARVTWGWYEEAIAARDEISALLEELALSGLGGDASYSAALELRRALFAAVPPQDESLPRLGSITLAAATPALVLAARLYDDPARADEIAVRNHLRHPGFLPAAVALEVLTDA
jgi:prophage DNA circulation protein